METNTMDITKLIPLIDKASTASFQWLFVVVLALFLWFSYMVFRHLIRQQDESSKQYREDSAALHQLSREDSKSYQVALMDLHLKAAERGEKQIAVISENSIALSQNRTAMDRLNSTLCKVQ